MSLFTLIKYPVSDPPTWEELHELPRDLFEQWLYHPLGSTDGKKPRDIVLLRILMMEYEE